MKYKKEKSKFVDKTTSLGQRNMLSKVAVSQRNKALTICADCAKPLVYKNLVRIREKSMNNNEVRTCITICPDCYRDRLVRK